jgi:hypothetical protein
VGWDHEQLLVKLRKVSEEKSESQPADFLDMKKTNSNCPGDASETINILIGFGRMPDTSRNGNYNRAGIG